MQLKDLVDQYLTQNYNDIEKARRLNNFSWKPVVTAINHIDLDPNDSGDRDYVRERFRNLRRKSSIVVIPENKTVSDKAIPRRLIYDVEVSPNICFSWNVGRKCYLDTTSIIKERSIICICWKFEGEKEVNSLQWDRGDDREMLLEFAKIINSADEIVGHNSDSFDTKWVRGRCLYHNIPVSSKINSIDTLKLARKQFRLNSNKLDYLGQFLGLGRKLDTGGFDLWRKICLDNDKESLSKMVAYCCQDVILLEKVYNKLREFSPKHTFRLTKKLHE